MSYLFVCHYATAEVSYFLARLMGRPPFIFDTWTEYSKLYKNRRHSLSLLGAATAYGSQKLISEEEKDRFRDMCIEQNTWTDSEKEEILEYCKGDVLMNEYCFYKILNDLPFLYQPTKSPFPQIPINFLPSGEYNIPSPFGSSFNISPTYF